MGHSETITTPSTRSNKRRSKTTNFSKTPFRRFGTSTSFSALSSSSQRDSWARKSGTTNATVETAIACVCSGRGISSKTVGIAVLQPERDRLFLGQFFDQASYLATCAVLTKFDLTDIVVSRTLLDKKLDRPQLVKELESNFADLQLSKIERKYFNDHDGLHTVRRLNMFSDRLPALELQLKEKYYALASVNALIKYVETTWTSPAPAARSLKISILPPLEGMCLIDAFSARELELVRSLSSQQSEAHKFTLFDVINYTCTAAGHRALKLRLLQPFKDPDRINEQLNNVEELISNPEILEDLRTLLDKTSDFERILSGLNTAAARSYGKPAAVVNVLQNLLTLKLNLGLLESFETLLDSLADSNCLYLRSIHKFLQDSRYSDIAFQINRYLVPEAVLTRGVLDSLNTRICCIRPGISLTLDEYRKLYGELVADAERLFKQLAADYKLAFRLAFNAPRGFYLSLNKKGFFLGSLPDGLVKITSSRTAYHLTTDALLQINERLNWVTDTILGKTLLVLDPLLEDIKPYTEGLYKLAEILTELDVTCSLAALVTCNYGYVRPQFSARTTAVERSRHPVYTRHWTAQNQDAFECNSIFFTKHDNIMVLSGPNNSGKTVYMKQVVLLQILAQIGSYVPAEWAVFRPASSIMSRTGHGDDLKSNCSTFMLEVLRLGQVIRHIEEDSLLIIDELGRGTSEEDGSALCFAVGSYLRNFECFVIFSTHFELVMHLERFYPNVSNYHMEATADDNGRLSYRHTLAVGATPLTSYGIAVALQNGVSQSVCERAAEIARKIWLDTRPFRPLDEGDDSLLALRRRASQLRRKVFMLSRGHTVPVQATDELKSEILQLEKGVKEFEEGRTTTGEQRPVTAEIDRLTRAGHAKPVIPSVQSVAREAAAVSPFFDNSPVQSHTKGPPTA